MKRESGRTRVAEWIVLIGFCASAASAGVNAWSSGGPNVISNLGSVLAISPSNPSVVYLAAGVSGVFRSDDGGETWTLVPSPSDQPVSTVMVHPGKDLVAYAVANGQIFRTDAGGVSWSARTIALDSTSVASVSSLSIDQSNPSTLYAGTSAGLFRSNDDGIHWARANLALPGLSAVLSDPARPSTVFAAGNFLFRSDDGGTTWSPLTGLVTPGHTQPYVSSIVGDPASVDTIYVISDQGAFGTTDAGKTWKLLKSSLDIGYPASIAAQSGRLYLSSANSGLFESTDGGASWTSHHAGLPQASVQSVVIDPQHPTTVYVGTADGVFKSSDGGATFVKSSAGVRGAWIESLAIDSVNPLKCLAGTDHGLYRTVNGGRSWEPGGLESQSVQSIAASPAAPSNLFAATNAGLFASQDGGETWLSANNGFVFDYNTPTVSALAIDPKTPTMLYAAIPTGLYKSTDSATSWFQTGLSVQIFALTIDPINSSVIYAGTEADYGYGAAPGTLDLLVKSNDGGSSWNRSQTGFSNEVYLVSAIAVDRSNNSVLYAGTNAGVFKSMDAGNAWAIAGSELASFYVAGLAIDPLQTSTIYATTSQGIYRSKDGGSTWQSFNRGFGAKVGSLSAGSLAIDQTGRVLYAGTGTRGAFSYQFPAGPTDLTAAANGGTQLLSIDTEDLRLQLVSLNGAGGISQAGPYGPYTGWAPGRIAEGRDGLTRVLWNNDDGTAALWLLRGAANQVSDRLESPLGRAIDVNSAPSGVSHVLWTDDDGRVAISAIENGGQVSNSPIFGPYFDWTAVAEADGADGLARVLWNKADGSAALSIFGPEGLLSSYRYGPAGGWTAVDLAAGADGQMRILWSNVDGRVALWRVTDSGAPTARGPVYEAPAGFFPAAVTAGDDGLERILLTDMRGAAVVWFMSADNVFLKSVEIAATNSVFPGPAWSSLFDKKLGITARTKSEHPMDRAILAQQP